MTGARALVLTAVAITTLFVGAAAVSYAAARGKSGGPTSLSEWAAGSIRPVGRAPQSGAELFERYGCRSCHTLDGRGASVGPVLNGVRNRKTRAEILVWLRDPAKQKPGTKMPRYPFRPLEPELIADYLLGK